MKPELTYPERIRLAVSMLRSSGDPDRFEEQFDKELQMFESFRPVEKQCREAIRIFRAKSKKCD